ncbi:L-aspartate oxidase [Halosegnis longus]|uniref:L-aspartate oxidase n=1 Tax=Halosegnis longus TaxID=2216012 RepID=UPI00096AB855|nr:MULTISPECIES: FAD-dependent oxidoreductase [Halobacteriales]
MKTSESETLVVGGGIAGCAAALAADRAGGDVVLATKATRPEETNSYWAQGGVAVTRSDPETFREDIIEAGAGACDPAAVETLVREARPAVDDVLVETLGVPFDTNGEGFDYGREAAHSESRILHVDAATGAAILPRFLEHLREETAVTVREDTAALDLITHEGRVHGALLERDGDVSAHFAGGTVLATGGIGAAYDRTTNPDAATGDGIAMGALAGADVADMEYVQFHPTAFAGEEENGTFLLSEAVRGKGAVLRNGDGERFMPDVHSDGSLAPRDVVARAVATERAETGEVRLDVSEVAFESSFPGLAKRCRDRGVDPAEGIPVAPAEHFCCGGLAVDMDGRTSLDRLFAAGECARTGVHGANRLASTSLLEGLVVGRRAGRGAVGTSPERVEVSEPRDSDPDLPARFATEKGDRLRRTMTEHVGIERTSDGLRRAATSIRRLKGEVDAYTRTRTSRELYELRNATVTALLVVRAATENDESRGCHYLADTEVQYAD